MSEIAEIDADRALELLGQVVAAKGEDFTYRALAGSSSGDGRCTYVRDGAPSCLVGHALRLAGWPVDELEELDTHPDPAIDALFASKRLSRGITAEAVDVLSWAQQIQDQGDTWGTALVAAENAHASYLTKEMSGESDDN